MALNFAEKVPFNIISDIIKVVTITLLGIWVTPYYIQSLGISAYGLVSLAITATSYMTIITTAIGDACSRYNVVAIRKNSDISKTMSTSFFGIGRLCLILVPIVVVISVIAPNIFETGNVTDIEVQILFLFVLLASLVSSVGSVFRSVYTSQNSSYYTNLIDCANSIIQVILIVSLFIAEKPTVMYIGISFFGASVITSLMTYYFSNRVYSNYELKIKHYDKDLYKDIGNLSKWNIVSSIGSVLYIQASVIVVNILLGSKCSGQFGIISSFISIITMATVTITRTFGPFTLRYYSDDNMEMMSKVLSSGVKVVSLMVAMPLAYIMVFSPQILTAWVGSEYSSLSVYLIPIAIAFVWYCSRFSFSSVPSTFLAVDKSSRISIVFGLVNVVLAIILCKVTDWGLMSVVVAYAISIFLYSIYYVLLCEKLIGLKRFHFIKLQTYGVVLLVVSFVVLSLINTTGIVVGNWFSVIISFLIMFIVYFVIMVTLLPKSDKDMIENILTGKFKSLFHDIFNKSGEKN